MARVEIPRGVSHHYGGVDGTRAAAARSSLLGNKVSTNQAGKAPGRPTVLRPEDIVLIKGIKSLLYVEGYTIKGVQKLLRETGKSAAMEAETEEVTAASNAEEGPQGRLSLESPFRGELEATLRELEDLRGFLRKIVG